MGLSKTSFCLIYKKTLHLDIALIAGGTSSLFHYNDLNKLFYKIIVYPKSK